MKHAPIPILFLVLASLPACKASMDLEILTDPESRIGAEVQAYPAGVIPGVRWEWPRSDRDVWFGRFAYNFADRGDFGEHDDESGGGFGLGAGWRRWQDDQKLGWHYGARLDFWDLDIDWRDNAPTTRQGATNVLVVQPTIEGGYSWNVRKGGRLDLTLGLGAELNVSTDGEDVGEGAILLLGISYMPSKR